MKFWDRLFGGLTVLAFIILLGAVYKGSIKTVRTDAYTNMQSYAVLIGSEAALPFVISIDTNVVPSIPTREYITIRNPSTEYWLYLGTHSAMDIDDSFALLTSTSQSNSITLTYGKALYGLYDTGTASISVHVIEGSLD